MEERNTVENTAENDPTSKGSVPAGGAVMVKHRRRKKNRHGRGKSSPLFFPILLAVVAVGLLFWRAANRSAEDISETLAYPRSYSEIVTREAENCGLPESLVYAVIKAESSFDPEAQSPVGAMGLMQMMPDTFKWMQRRMGESYETEALFDPDTSIRYGCAYLRLMLDTFEDELATALAAYNAGPGNVTGWLSDKAYSDDGRMLKSIPFGETERYVEKVLQYKESYEKLYDGGM